MTGAILVVNAGSSSLKFQSFGLRGNGLERRLRGQMDGIGVRPRLRAVDGAGAVLIDRAFDPAAIADLPAAIG
ncbi:MAG: acetate kinase, partial [Pikeienuella sp.]